MNIAVSACLTGIACRFDGASKPCAEVLALRESHRLILICPEVAGGLRAPHPANEIVSCENRLRVIDSEGCDNTDMFLLGAQKTLERVQSQECRLVVMKAKSPSCGNGYVYDGTFSKTLVEGYGVAACLLRAHGIRVLDEKQLRSCLTKSMALRTDEIVPLLADSSKECPVLLTEHLIMRPLVGGDAETLNVWCDNFHTVSNNEWGLQCKVDGARTFIEKTASSPHIFGVFRRFSSGESASCIGLLGLVPDYRRRDVDSLALNYVFAQHADTKDSKNSNEEDANRLHGNLMGEAICEISRYGFEELGLRAISCVCSTDDVCPRRVLEQSGFSYEGVLHSVQPDSKGILKDIVLYNLTI